jgi:hypothetical protein
MHVVAVTAQTAPPVAWVLSEIACFYDSLSRLTQIGLGAAGLLAHGSDDRAAARFQIGLVVDLE